MGGRGSKNKSDKAVGAVVEKQQKAAEMKPLGPDEKKREEHVEYSDIVSGHEEFIKAQEGWGKSLTTAEHDAVYDYQGSGFRDMNGVLRMDEKPNDQHLKDQWFQDSPSIRKSIGELTSAIEKASLHNSVIVYRGTGLKYSEEQLKSMVGKTYYESGFMSTSLKKDFALSWKHHDNSVAFKIKMPKGAKAAYVDAKSQYGTSMGEYELLIQRGARFEITGYHTEKVGYAQKERTVIDMKYLGQKPLSQLKFKG